MAVNHYKTWKSRLQICKKWNLNHNIYSTEPSTAHSYSQSFWEKQTKQKVLKTFRFISLVNLYSNSTKRNAWLKTAEKGTVPCWLKPNCPSKALENALPPTVHKQKEQR